MEPAQAKPVSSQSDATQWALFRLALSAITGGLCGYFSLVVLDTAEPGFILLLREWSNKQFDYAFALALWGLHVLFITGGAVLGALVWIRFDRRTP